MPEQPWRSIRAFGNRLRHKWRRYTSRSRLWEIVTTDSTAATPRLRKRINHEVSRPRLRANYAIIPFRTAYKINSGTL